MSFTSPIHTSTTSPESHASVDDFLPGVFDGSGLSGLFHTDTADFVQTAADERLPRIGGADTRFREGTCVAVQGGPGNNTETLFGIALLASFSLNGKPVRCAGILPGVTLRASAGRLKAQDIDAFDWRADEMWNHARPKLADWLGMRSPQPVMLMELAEGARLEFGLDSQHRVRGGAMQIDVHHDAAFAAAYGRNRGVQPLVECPPAEWEIKRQRKIVLRRLLLDALNKSARSRDTLYARLPPAIRYRVTGALAAWEALREHAMAALQVDLSAALRTEPAKGFLEVVPNFVLNISPSETSDPSPHELAGIAVSSAVWQAFEVREGQFYEPTPALHRLLNASDIAGDVPVGMLRLPADTLCVTPEPSSWGQPGGFEAIVFFREAESLSVVTRSRLHDGSDLEIMQWLSLSLMDPDKTIQQALNESFEQWQVDEPVRRHWRNALDYGAKMLLYLTVRDAQILHDCAYTDAPRDFSGLGKRKRAERLAEIEQLYDRHIVGPAILDVELASRSPGDGTPREVRGHWRRPHFKMQPHGPRSSQRKLVFIGPTLVRPDRLGL